MDIESGLIAIIFDGISVIFLLVVLPLVVDTFSQLGQNSKARRIVAVKLS